MRTVRVESLKTANANVAQSLIENNRCTGLDPEHLRPVPTGNPSTQAGFGALTYATSPPTGLLGVGLGGDSSPRMIAFQARLEF